MIKSLMNSYFLIEVVDSRIVKQWITRQNLTFEVSTNRIFSMLKPFPITHANRPSET